mmetsp:Transcript_87/g.162  ORF Transcript_87/g.162 Transcript_87/m.162 type:complete len:231 (+) Transcript_87:1286-1978(+)
MSADLPVAGHYLTGGHVRRRLRHGLCDVETRDRILGDSDVALRVGLEVGQRRALLDAEDASTSELSYIVAVRGLKVLDQIALEVVRDVEDDLTILHVGDRAQGLRQLQVAVAHRTVVLRVRVEEAQILSAQIVLELKIVRVELPADAVQLAENVHTDGQLWRGTLVGDVQKDVELHHLAQGIDGLCTHALVERNGLEAIMSFLKGGDLPLCELTQFGGRHRNGRQSECTR